LAKLSLGDVDQVNVLLSPLMTMAHLNGPNVPFMNADSSTLPQRVQAIGYSPLFLDNYSIMLLLTVGEIIFAVVFYLITFYL
jgi:hypothetical protein